MSRNAVSKQTRNWIIASFFFFCNKSEHFPPRVMKVVKFCTSAIKHSTRNHSEHLRPNHTQPTRVGRSSVLNIKNRPFGQTAPSWAECMLTKTCTSMCLCFCTEHYWKRSKWFGGLWLTQILNRTWGVFDGYLLARRVAHYGSAFVCPRTSTVRHSGRVHRSSFTFISLRGESFGQFGCSLLYMY